jgi:hypothetical protein
MLGLVVVRPYMVKVKGVDDLVNVAVGAQVLLVHRTSAHSKTILFVPFPSYDSLAIYYCEVEGAFKGRYFLLNRFTGDVQVSESYVNDSKFVVVPIVDVVEQELLPKEFMEKYKVKTKKKKSRARGSPLGSGETP